MKTKIALPVLAGLAALSLALPVEASPGSVLTTIYSFGGRFATPPDGAVPSADLIADASGALYGTTAGGGTPTSGCPYGCGTVFKLSPDGAGGWTETVLHSFGEGADGAFPYSSLIMDASGALYGTTQHGGAYRYGNYQCRDGCGTVFKLSPDGAGDWTETVIYDFTGGADGATSYAGVIADAAGALYGTTRDGGNFNGACAGYGCGTVFKLTPDDAGGWTQTVLHAFTGGADGLGPRSALIFGETGALYGATYVGGPYGAGTIFKLSPDDAGGWIKTILHNFSGTDGTYPNGTLIADASGALYGTTNSDEVYGTGTVFKLSPDGAGGWSHNVLYMFSGGADGAVPFSGLTIDASGALYGTTYGGGMLDLVESGCELGCGTVFKLSPDGAGGWTQSVLYSFSGGADGNGPRAGLTADASGALYGTTGEGGSHDGGTVFRLPIPTTFDGAAGEANCRGQSVSPLVQQYGSLAAAAAALGFPSVPALQDAIAVYCQG